VFVIVFVKHVSMLRICTIIYNLNVSFVSMITRKAVLPCCYCVVFVIYFSFFVVLYCVMLIGFNLHIISVRAQAPPMIRKLRGTVLHLSAELGGNGCDVDVVLQVLHALQLVGA